MAKVLVIGAGFGGLNAAKELANHQDIQVVLVDEKNHHLFQPLLYQVATAGLNPADIAVPIRSILSRYRNIEIQMCRVEHIDLEKKEARCSCGLITFDYIILACGSLHSYFNHDEWEEHAPGLKTIEQAVEIRRRILQALENAEREQNPEIQKQLLTFVIIGGGPTGVELAGALGELTRFTLYRDFKSIDCAKARIILIEANSRLLGSFSPEFSQRAVHDLEKLGVTVRTSARVTDVCKDGVRLGEEFITAKTIIWAAGVEAAPLAKQLDLAKNKSGRIIVEKDLRVKTHPFVYVIGDMAVFKDDQGHDLPEVGSVAIQQGIHAARNILAQKNKTPTKPFKYRNLGKMATIGRSSAVVETPWFKMQGFLAWLFWLVVHIYFLIGFRNRIIVLIEWAWSYFSYSRGARLIVQREWKTNKSLKN